MQSKEALKTVPMRNDDGSDQSGSGKVVKMVDSVSHPLEEPRTLLA